MATKEDLEDRVDKLRTTYSEALDGYELELAIWDGEPGQESTKYRLRISPEDSTTTLNLGPAFTTMEHMEGYLRGLNTTGETIARKANRLVADH